MSCCRCGRHLAVKPTIIETIKQCDPDEKCFQCFIGNPTSYTVRTISKEDALESRDYLKKNNMTMTVHANYLINLCREGEGAEKVIEPSRKCLQKTLDELHKIGEDCTNVVFHVGAKGSINTLCENLNSMEIKVPLLAENAAGEGSKLGSTFEDMRKILEGTDSNKIGFCFDSCHSFSAAQCDFRDPSCLEKYFDTIDDLFSDRKVILHHNDSLTELGGRVDRHSPIGYAQIWSLHQPETLRTLERYYERAIMSGLDIIWETPNPYSKQLEMDLYKKV
jgi:deoxyribonuclease-4